MIFRIKGVDLEIEIQEGYTTVLEILDKQLFRYCIENIYENTQGLSNNEIVIEEDFKIVDYVKRVELIIDYFNIQVNSKNILQMLYKKIESEVQVNTEAYYKIESLLLEINNLLKDQIEEFDFSVTDSKEVTVGALLKMFDFKINYLDYPKVNDKLYLYLELIAMFFENKILVFVNFKSFFNVEEVEELYKCLNYKKINFFCIESEKNDIIASEIKYLIDQDLVEFGPFR